MSLPKIVTREDWLAAQQEPKGRSESARSARPDFAS